MKRPSASRRRRSSRPSTGRHRLCCCDGCYTAMKNVSSLKSFPSLRCCRSEEEMLKFMGLMNSSWVLDGHDIATAFNLSSFHSVVDLGGQRSNFDIFPSLIIVIWEENRVNVAGCSSSNRHTRQSLVSVCEPIAATATVKYNKKDKKKLDIRIK